MAETQIAQETTGTGAKSGLPVEKPVHIRLPDLPVLLLGQSEQNAWKASDEDFLRFARTLAEIQVEEGNSLERPWTWEDRRDFLNWCLDEGVLEIKDGRLLAVEERIPTALLSGECLE